jgi:uncharacterized Fe-S cluster protein YjdI
MLPMDENDRKYTNGEITVFWRSKKCIHATLCYKIIDIVNKCPTDALTYKYNKEVNESDTIGQKDVKIPELKPAEIQIMKDGPIVVTGKIKLTDADGKEYKTYSITSFCRCGASGNMPFCDGTHRKIGFTG